MRASIRRVTPRNRTRLSTRTRFIIVPGSGALFTVEPQYADLVAERLARYIPGWALVHVEAGDYWLVVPRFAETARWVVLITCGSLLRMWAESYPAALARLARGTRAVERENAAAA
jgi:hypothetical protein